MSKNKFRPISICRHEAGHAAFAYSRGFKVSKIEIRKSGGLCWILHGKRPDLYAVAQVALAGHAADVLFSRVPKYSFPPDDYKLVKMLGFRTLNSLYLLFEQTLEDVALLQDPIFALAKELKKDDLDGKFINQIMRLYISPYIIEQNIQLPR